MHMYVYSHVQLYTHMPRICTYKYEKHTCFHVCIYTLTWIDTYMHTNVSVHNVFAQAYRLHWGWHRQTDIHMQTYTPIENIGGEFKLPPSTATRDMYLQGSGALRSCIDGWVVRVLWLHFITHVYCEILLRKFKVNIIESW